MEAGTTVYITKVEIEENERLFSEEDNLSGPIESRDLEFISVKTEPGYESEAASGSRDLEFISVKTEAEFENKSSTNEEDLVESKTESTDLKRWEHHTFSGNEADDDSRSFAEINEVEKSLNESEIIENSSDPYSKKSNKTYVCKLCCRGFNGWWYFNEHREAVHGTRFFECEMCSEKFKRRHSLIKHIATHSDGPFKCSLCSRCYTHRSTLNVHMKTHTGFRYTCNVCFKSYGQKYVLTDHMRSHAGEFYNCAHCTKSFTFKQQLKRHVVLHQLNEGEWKYKCSQCNKGFTEKGNLNRHQKIHLGKSYPCTLCEKSFSRNGVLQRHVLGQHGSPACSKNS